MSKEDQAIKQAGKAQKREHKDENRAIVAAKQAVKELKQSGKQADRDLRAEKAEIKSENQVKSSSKTESDYPTRIYLLSEFIFLFILGRKSSQTIRESLQATR